MLGTRSDNGGNLIVMMDLNKGRSLVWYKKYGIPGIMSIDICKLHDTRCHFLQKEIYVMALTDKHLTIKLLKQF